jgi:hypothetical protein
MLILELGRTLQADREREIDERLRHRRLIQDALEAIATGGLQETPTEPRNVKTTGTRPAGGRSFGILARGRSR